MEKERVLFLCTGNSCRSQMAEAFLRHYGGERFDVYSAGLKPGAINPYTYRVMAEIGYDLAGQFSKGVDFYLGKVHFHHVITVCDDADRNCPVIWMRENNRLHWSFEDPASFEGTDAEKLEKFREVREKIEKEVRDWVSSLDL
jgi:arsenate reductase